MNESIYKKSITVAGILAITLPTIFMTLVQASYSMIDGMFIANIIVLKMIFHINQQNHYEMENALLYMQITQQEKRIREEEKTIGKFNYCVMI